jgi:hypothetical protein
MLTEGNKLSRMHFCLSERGANGLFKDMFDCIHVDEKMFLLTKEVERYILAEGKEAPLRTLVHKSYIPKVMFYAANTCPRRGAGSNQMFNGKVGMWPLAAQVPAVRSSRNRPASTLEWKSHSMTKQVYTTIVFEKLAPAILEKWPHISKCILIQ